MDTLPARTGHGAPPARAEVEDAPPRLSEMDFTDLYVSTSGEAFIKGLIEVKDPLYPVPEGAIEDLHVIHRRVCELGQRDTEFTIDHDGARYRVSRIDDEINPTYVLRRAIYPIPRFRTLGVHKLVARQLAMAGRQGERGLVLFSGATGAGKTTTACSLLQEYLITFGGVAIAIEDPPELKMNGPHGPFGLCYQVRVRQGDFSTPLRLAMRQAPRYIYLGEIRDAESAHEALQAANSGHVVVATTHAGTIEEAVNRLTKLVSSKVDINLARDLMADGLSAVISQQMTRIQASDGRVERRVGLQTLFFGDDAGLRTMIREGKTQQIGTTIDQQANRIQRGEAPVAPRSASARGAAAR